MLLSYGVPGQQWQGCGTQHRTAGRTAGGEHAAVQRPLPHQPGIRGPAAGLPVPKCGCAGCVQRVLGCRRRLGAHSTVQSACSLCNSQCSAAIACTLPARARDCRMPTLLLRHTSPLPAHPLCRGCPADLARHALCALPAQDDRHNHHRDHHQKHGELKPLSNPHRRLLAGPPAHPGQPMDMLPTWSPKNLSTGTSSNAHAGCAVCGLCVARLVCSPTHAHTLACVATVHPNAITAVLHVSPRRCAPPSRPPWWCLLRTSESMEATHGAAVRGGQPGQALQGPAGVLLDTAKTVQHSTARRT